MRANDIILAKIATELGLELGSIIEARGRRLAK